MSTMARMDFRLRRENKELIELAAELLGMTVTQFADAHLVQDARRVIAEHNITRLTDRDRDIFLAMLDSDAEPNAALRRAFQKASR